MAGKIAKSKKASKSKSKKDPTDKSISNPEQNGELDLSKNAETSESVSVGEGAKVTPESSKEDLISQIGSIMAGAIELEVVEDERQIVADEDSNTEDLATSAVALGVDGSTKSFGSKTDEPTKIKLFLFGVYTGLKNLPNKLFGRSKQKKLKVKVSSDETRTNKFGLATASLLAFAGIVLLVVNVMYEGRLLPNTKFADISLSSNPETAREQIEKKLKEYNLEFEYKNNIEQFNPAEAGVSLDSGATFNYAINLSNQVRYWEKPFALFSEKEVEIQFDIDRQILRDLLISNNYGDKIPEDAKLEFNEEAEVYEIIEESEGRGINVDELLVRLEGSVAQLKNEPLDLRIETIMPDITKASLQDTLFMVNKYINQDVLIRSSVKNYKPGPGEVKNWLILESTQELRGYEISVDKAAVERYLEGVAGSLNVKVENRVVVPLETGQVVLKAGRAGRKVANLDASKHRLTSSVDSVESADGVIIDLIVEEEPFNTENLGVTEGRWMFSDLSEFRVYAYEGTTMVRSFSMSAGVRSYPTVTGVYDVWAKVRKQTMRGGSQAGGDFYEVENVEWVAYWHKGYAFHGVWWHNEFGVRNRSHGCIGMSNADAQWVYNFVSVGTPVVVVR